MNPLQITSNPRLGFPAHCCPWRQIGQEGICTNSSLCIHNDLRFAVELNPMDDTTKVKENISQLRSILKRSSVDETSKSPSEVKLFADKDMFSFNMTLKDRDDVGFDNCPKSPKKVSFADTLQKSLVEIRNFTPSNEDLNLWSDSAYFQNYYTQKRWNGDNTAPNNEKVVIDNPATIVLSFKDPSLHPAFKEVFQHQNVALEKCSTRDRSITGIILVKNIDFKKRVFIRHTVDKWRTMMDTDASYLPNSTDGLTDRFMFTLHYPKNYPEMEFCICYSVQSGEFWDNNHRKNYKVQDVLLLPA